AKSLAGEAGIDEEAAKRRGRQIHRLLEFLPTTPADHWPSVAARLLSGGADAADPVEVAELLEETSKVLRSDALAAIFRPDALAEVSLSAALSELGGARIHGTVDRLIIDNTTIL